MEDMPKHPRLAKRGSTFWHRAAIPADIKNTYPKSEETFSLKTKDPREALVLVRKAAAEVDERFATHRRRLATQSSPSLLELTAEQIARIEELYYAHLLDEDEEVRLDGFYEADGEKPAAPTPTFEEYVEAAREFGQDARHMLARGKVDVFFRGEAEEVLTWEGLELRLDPASPSWKPAGRAIQSAIVRAQSAIAGRNAGDIVPTPAPPVSPKAAMPSKSGAPLASTVRREWLEEKSKERWVAKTRHEHEVWTQHFLDLVGDRAIDTYTKADGRAFKQALQRLPANWNKHKSLRDLQFVEAVDRAGELSLPPMSSKNINKLMQFVGSMWLWATRHYDEVTASPFKGLSIDIGKRARDDRDPFTSAQLEKLFSAPIYTGCASARRWKEAGNEVLSDSGRYWVPLISLFSGARLGEVVQLRVEDVKEERGVLRFALVDEADDQRLKNENSRRSIPVHPLLTELGLPDLLERRHRSGEARLFPDLELGKDGYYSSTFSKFFGRFLESVGAKTHKTSFHSFRHNFEDACRAAGMPTNVMNALQGHGEEGMAGRYGQGFDLATLNQWMRKIVYPELDLSHLRQRVQSRPDR
jgi:integrase